MVIPVTDQQLNKTEPPTPDPALKRRAIGDVVKYTAIRFAMVILVALAIHLLALAVGVRLPVAITLILALVLALPLSFFVFKGLRLRVTEELNQWRAQRQANKAWVERELAER